MLVAHSNKTTTCKSNSNIHPSSSEMAIRHDETLQNCQKAPSSWERSSLRSWGSSESVSPFKCCVHVAIALKLQCYTIMIYTACVFAVLLACEFAFAFVLNLYVYWICMNGCMAVWCCMAIQMYVYMCICTPPNPHTHTRILYIYQ